MQPEFSVVIPIYNTESYLNTCVDSVLNQTYQNFEIILVDDGSPDRSPTICDAYAEAHDCVSVIHQKNAGLSASRNNGLKAAKGEYVMYLDSDDYIEPESLERIHEVIEAYHPDMICPDMCDVIDGEKIPARRTMLEPNRVYSAKDFIILSIQGRHWWSCAPFSIYRREFLLENNLFFTEGILHEDVDFQPRVFLAAKSIVYLDYPFYNYVRRSGSIMLSDKNIKRRIEDSNGIFSRQRALYDQVEDTELRKYLYGMLIKQYMHAVRELKHRSLWHVQGMTFSFMFANALNLKEKLKVVLYKTHICY